MGNEEPVEMGGPHEVHCENCGKPLLPGEEIIHSASGEVTEDGELEVGDHFYMHAKCPGDETRLYTVEVNGEGFVYLNDHEIHHSIWLEEAKKMAERMGDALGIESVNLDGQPIADELIDFDYSEICAKTIQKHEESLNRQRG